MTRQLDGVVSDGTLIVRALHFAGRAELVSADFSGSTDDGSEYAWSTHVVALYDEQGRTLRRENFPPEQFTEALAKLDELGAATTAGPPDLDNGRSGRSRPAASPPKPPSPTTS